MNIKLNTEKLNDVLVSFYEMNGMRIVIFDSVGNEIMAYPKDKCSFCKEVRSCPSLNELCQKSDSDAFLKSIKNDDIYIYKCHAGLVEAVMPLRYSDQIVGYIMFGQITDIKNKTILSELVSQINNRYNLNCNSKGIKFRSRKQIIAASKILEICSEYIILKEMIEPQNDRIIALAKKYIKENYQNQINVDDICTYCGCGRTKLYEMFKKEYGTGIAHYINKLRLSAAKKLLKSTSLSIAEISEKCGFYDYNYFSRVYKKHFGISPRNERTPNL